LCARIEWSSGHSRSWRPGPVDARQGASPPLAYLPLPADVMAPIAALTLACLGLTGAARRAFYRLRRKGDAPAPNPHPPTA
jgi:hypothetical protein